MLNPFLGVDHAWMSGPTFPPHSHAGFSAVSYLFLDAETGIANQHSAGTKNLIRPGGIHWASAGSGIVHEEVPAESGKTVHSLQIFVDLPAEYRAAASLLDHRGRGGQCKWRANTPVARARRRDGCAAYGAIEDLNLQALIEPA